MCDWKCLFYLCVFFYIFISSFPPISPVQSVKSNCEKYVCLVDLDLFVGVQFCIIILGLVLLILNLFRFCRVAYVTYCTNLTIIDRKIMDKNTFTSEMNECMLYWLLIALIAAESTFDINLANFLHFYLASSIKHSSPTLKVYRSASHTLSFVIYFFILGISVTPATHVLCLIVTYFLCVKVIKNIPFWVPFLLILLANDIELNPGDKHQYHENFFNFMNWNLNSLGKNNFERVKLIEAHNSLFNYDLISLCETSLNSETDKRIHIHTCQSS